MEAKIIDLLSMRGLQPPLPADVVNGLFRNDLPELAGLNIFSGSATLKDGVLFCMGGRGIERCLIGLSLDQKHFYAFEGDRRQISINGRQTHVLTAPISAANAAGLRNLLPFLNPMPLGLTPSAGCGDRLGLATPGHIRAVAKTGLALIPAQQSVRENARTGRTPQAVLNDAVWALFQEGWREGYGADADHLKTSRDVDAFVDAGYTFFTIDPGDHVDNSAHCLSKDLLLGKVEALPWQKLESTPADLIRRLTRRPIQLEHFSLSLTEEEILRAAVKYGRVVVHTAELYRHLKSRKQSAPFELEVSVDETDSVTSPAEHIYIAAELKRLGVAWVSLAPRYVGGFEKGVDYIGDLGEFEDSFALHAAVANAFGPYKLSLHSGSDKFSIYPIVAHLAKSRIHLKTAGTSYLEALRALALVDPELFRKIFAFAVQRYPEDRATYHVSAETARLPRIDQLPDGTLCDLLEDFHAREILHVTYGSVLNHPELRPGIFTGLHANLETYYHLVEKHFNRHFKPFV